MALGRPRTDLEFEHEEEGVEDDEKEDKVLERSRGHQPPDVESMITFGLVNTAELEELAHVPVLA